jgi:mRNA interferase RelE/StbE
VYDIAITRSAQKDMRRLQSDDQDRIDDAILKLGDNPRPQGSTKLSCREPLYRVRVGDYRVVYEIDDFLKVVTIARVRHRSEVYDNL